MKPISVVAKKVKDGYLIPDSPELEGIKSTEIIVKIISKKSDSASEKIIKEKKSSKKNPADDKSWKELAAEAAVERYEEKAKNQVPSKLTEEQINIYKKKWGMEDINTIDDVIRSLKEKKK
ncbi:MAG: hypothetical protein WDA74_11975 [Spirochaetota bacterium]